MGTLVILTYAGILFPTVIIFNNDKGVLNYSFLFSLNSFSEKLILFIFLISLAGLPPLAGFYLKMIVIFIYATLMIFSLVSQIIKRNFTTSRSHIKFPLIFGISIIFFFPIILLG